MAESDAATQRPEGGVAAKSGVLPRLVAAARMPMWHEAQAFRQRRAIEQHPLWQTPPPDAAGLPVLLIGGMGSTPALLSPLRELLKRRGHLVSVAPVRFGIGCGEVTARAVEDALVNLVEATTMQAVVIAHSRGGQFARAVAVRRPDLVGGLVTLGSPLTRMLAVHPLLLVHIAALGAAGALGVPGLLRPGCLWGSCCAALRGDLSGRFPDTVPFLSIYSRKDRIVDWRSSLDPAARHLEVTASHGGLLWSHTSLTAITVELATLAGTGPADTPTITHERAAGRDLAA